MVNEINKKDFYESSQQIHGVVSLILTEGLGFIFATGVDLVFSIFPYLAKIIIEFLYKLSSVNVLIYPIYIHRHYHQPHIYIRTHDTLSTTAFVAQLVERGFEFDSHRWPWSCIFCNWSQLRIRKTYTLVKILLIDFLY